MKSRVALAAVLVGLFISISVRADAQTVVAAQAEDAAPTTAATPPVLAPPVQAKTPTPKKKPGWLMAPIVSSSPKLGTSFGGLGMYLHYFDPDSQVSMFGGGYQYSTTHSMFGVMFARTSFDADHQRIVALAGFGKIENVYEDYLGTGQTVTTTDDLHLLASRYLYRVKGDWFLGGQGIFTNYTVSGATPADNEALELLGIDGFVSGGLGATLMHDSRDSPDMPGRGWYSAVYNISNRESLGAQKDYDTYRWDNRLFFPTKAHVLAVRQNNQFTVDAPTSAESTVLLRGYKVLQYYARHMSSVEAEERLRLARRWGVTIFGGGAWLYGGSSSPVNSDGAYPTAGMGLQFILKPDEKMLLNLEYAHGNKSNYGIYLKFGYSW